MATILLVTIANFLTESGRVLLRLAAWLNNLDFDKLDKDAGNKRG